MHCKTRLTALILCAVIMLATAGITQAETMVFNDSWGNAGFNLIDQDGAGVEVVFSITEMAINDQQIDGQTMQLVQIPGIYLPNDEGAPNLPGTGRYIALPEGATARVDIIEVRTEIYQNLNLAPAPKIPLETDDTPLAYVQDPDIYQRDAYYPAEPAMLSEVTELRGVDAVVLGITPFQYNPVKQELVVYRDIRVRVSFVGGTGYFGEDRLRSRYWDPILRDHLLNFASLPEVDFNRTSTTDETNCEYLIISPDDAEFVAWADTIKAWRNQQGIITGISTVSEIGGSDHTTISNYLINAYYTWDIPPVAVLILSDLQTSGDQYGIDSPTWNNYCYSDNMYSDVSANGLPDFAIARIAAQDEAGLETMINKMLDYERTPPTAPNFYDQPLMAGGWQTERWFILCTEVVYGYFEQVHGKSPVREYAIYEGEPGTYWSTNSNTWMILNYFGPSGLGYIPLTPEHLTDWTGNAAGINAAINSGAFIVQHRDHGYETGWGEPSYSSSSLNGLNNDMLPFVFSTNCCTGMFGLSTPCFSESFHRMEQGCLGIIGASEVSYSFVNDTYQWGVYDAMWPDFDPGYGDAGDPNLRTAFGNASGKIYLSASGWPSNPNNKVHTYNLFHHFGDAFMTLYSEVPQNLTVSHPPVIFSTATNVNVTADAGALIALTVDNEVIATAEGTGVPLAIGIDPQLPNDNILVTVTKPNYYRYSDEIMVITEEANYVIFYALQINDETGNDNAMLDHGENVYLTVGVENLGTADATNIEAVISSEDSYITILDDNHNYPAIPTGGRAYGVDAYQIEAAGDVPDQHEIEFTMTATNGDSTWTSEFTIIAHAPAVNYDDLTIDDILGGNGDNHLDPGETADFTVTVANDGTGDSDELTLVLSCDDPLITIGNDTAVLTELLAGTTGDPLFVGITADEMIAQGDTVEFSIEMTSNSGYQGSFSFPLVIGDLRRNPMGPDAYGYYAYDMTDGDNAPAYDWMEIAPAAGGPGIDLPLGDNTFYDVTLPFTFQFYGVEYTQVAIGSHGWVQMGAGGAFYPGNMPIPHIVTPNQMVAGYWDDLSPGTGGQVATYYDSGNNRFIVEYYMVVHAADPLEAETFQVILYDPLAYPTLTGDGDIVVQYLTVSNIVDYCTVGIEDHTAEIGIQYLFNDDYDVYAQPLQTGLAVRFSTVEPPNAMVDETERIIPAEFALGQNYPNPFNPTTTLRFDLPRDARVHLAVYDISGRLVATLADGWRQAGSYETVFDAAGLASGVYLYRLEADEFTANGKMLLLK